VPKICNGRISLFLMKYVFMHVCKKKICTIGEAISFEVKVAIKTNDDIQLMVGSSRIIVVKKNTFLDLH
jgi:hypothetical protein